jgi:hypothetical protein
MPPMPATLRPDEIPANLEFEIKAVFNEENRRLNAWLEQEAAEALGSPTSS